MSNSALEVKGLSKSYGEKSVLKDLSFSAALNDFSVICGKPGNGKSVLVRTIMGLEEIDSGQIIVRDQDVTNANSGSRNIGYIPQSFALYPHFSVRENIEYPLDLINATKEEKVEAVARVSELLKIADLLEKKPVQLSGGQKQRVAIARGLSKSTDVYVLDDPLVGLDFKLRERLIDDLRQTQEKLKVAFVYVTSDPLEALQLAKTVLILADGKIVQQSNLNEVYDNPSHLSSMATLGFPEVNVFSGEMNGSTFSSSVFKVGTDIKSDYKGAIAGIRPEGVLIGSQPGSITIDAKLTLMENLGSEFVAYLDVKGVQISTVVSRTDLVGIKLLESKDLKISIKAEAITLFDAISKKKIGKGVSLV
ncbi:MAG: ABC transporter ATP-binding protein [Candidatus Nanopelagicaceae bacterium]|nr:ABC transporter ATP-binding protein [Candidatus Nanopelagicaceae bacterium]